MSDETATQGLAAVVSKPRAQAAIDALTEEGVYDDSRSVQSWDTDSVAVPVTDPPTTVDVREIVRQAGVPRLRTLEDHLRQRGWTDEELDSAPSSWAVVGSVILVDVDDSPRPEEVGQALLALHGEADTVLAREGISGQHREPDGRVLAGEGDTETVHTEHGTQYGLDLAEVMFSPGNKAERARMGDVVDAEERVLDMFAGIGYFTLPMARADAHVSAVERNPTAFRYLVENVRLNGVDDHVHPYRADCRDVVPEFARTDRADRVVMGYYDAWEYLDVAMTALTPGGVVHMHEATPEAVVFERPIERLEAAATDAGRDVEILDTHRVKGYSEGVAHVVVDAQVR